MAKKKADDEPTGFTMDEGDELPSGNEAQDERDAEIAALKAENARLKAEKSASLGIYPAGKKYKVSLKDGPTAVVLPELGEHPFDAFKRLGGIVSSVNAPEISEAGDNDECGTVLANGKVRPFAAA